VLFVANDYRKKGLEALLAAMTLLPSDIYLAVVGNPTHIPLFRLMAQAKGIEERVFFLGSLKDMDSAYIAADMLAHPTQEDTFAMVVLEAMSHGLPVVVSVERYCGISGLLQDGVQALLLSDPTNASALAERIKLVLCDPVTKSRLTLAATKYANTCIWSEIAVQQEKIYRSSIVGQH
jgi:UDP-glucose:(heptosyl)LPS alpha-1,3-glucosyltransferase